MLVTSQKIQGEQKPKLDGDCLARPLPARAVVSCKTEANLQAAWQFPDILRNVEFHPNFKFLVDGAGPSNPDSASGDDRLRKIWARDFDGDDRVFRNVVL